MAIETMTKHRGRTHLSRQTVQLDHEAYEAVLLQATQHRSVQINSHKIAIWSDQPFKFNIGNVLVEAVAGSPMLPTLSQPVIIDWTPGDYISVLRGGDTDGTFHIIGCY